MVFGGQKINWAWAKGTKKFLAKYGTRDAYALDLLMMGDIKLTKSDCEKLDISGQSEVYKITPCEARKILISKGFEWKKIENG